MNSANQVTVLINDWKSQGMTKSEIVIKTAEALLFSRMCDQKNDYVILLRHFCQSIYKDRLLSVLIF